MTIAQENFIIEVKGRNPLLADLYLCDKESRRPVIVYLHGYKGFKDWGHIPLLPKVVNEHRFNFLKFNFSHNGGTLDNPVDFPDLESFAKNNYSIELEDVQTVLNWLTDNENPFKSGIDKEEIYLLGHSRGGGIAILTASRDKRVKKLVTWSAVGDFARRFPIGEALQNWKNNGVMYVENSRTEQKMPHYYQFYEDFRNNREKLDISEAERILEIPHLLIHGTMDETVLLGEALRLMSLNEHTSLIKLHGATHTLGGFHPYKKQTLPHDVDLALNYTLTFLGNE